MDIKKVEKAYFYNSLTKRHNCRHFLADRKTIQSGEHHTSLLKITRMLKLLMTFFGHTKTMGLFYIQ